VPRAKEPGRLQLEAEAEAARGDLAPVRHNYWEKPMLKNWLLALVLAAIFVSAAPAFAELQNLTVGGSIRIRGNWYSASAHESRDPLRWPADAIPFRAVGPTNPITSAFSYSDRGHNHRWVEQRTSINFKADFTNDVAAYIELDSYDVWGEDFRSDYLTGADFRQAHADGDLEIYQAYIEMNETFAFPLRLRIGRQELSFGSEWLLGTNDTAAFFPGLSHDAVRATWATAAWSVDAFGAKLAENSPAEEDGDVDLYGVYASYYGLPNITIDAYWLFLRDAVARRDTHDINFGLFSFPQIIEDVFGVDDYGVTKLHTIGLRAAGTVGALDFELEGAYQFGNASAAGFLYRTGVYGDDDANWDNWALNLEVGYTVDMLWTPRVYLGFAYLGGEDNRNIDFVEWLVAMVNPFYQPRASVSFNRLFSNWEYSEFIENTDLSNAMVFRGGVSVAPTENVEILLAVSHFRAIEEWDEPWNFYFLGERIVPLPFLPWLTREVDRDLGWEIGIYLSYAYSEDLSFEVGYAHLFTGDGLKRGQFINGNGHFFNGGAVGSLFGRGRGNDDADYAYFETKISF
jgi:hypothetical protein